MRLVLTLLFLASTASACARGELAGPKIPPTFTVKVVNEYGPVAGLRVEVTHFRSEDYAKATTPPPKRPLDATTDEIERVVNNPPRQTHTRVSEKAFTELIAVSTTDQKGIANFSLKVEGEFYLSVGNAAFTDGVTIQVSKDATSGPLTFEWPQKITELSALQGTFLRGWAGSSYTTPLAEATLTLVEMISLRRVGSITTTEAGSFHFNNVPPGKYFLQVKAKDGGINDPDGSIPVVVKSTALRHSLDLTVAQTDCGLLYDKN